MIRERKSNHTFKSQMIILPVNNLAGNGIG